MATSETATSEEKRIPGTYIESTQEARDNASFGHVPCPLYPYSEDVGEDLDCDLDLSANEDATNFADWSDDSSESDSDQIPGMRGLRLYMYNL